VIVVDRRVLVAGVTMGGVGVSHVRQLSITVMSMVRVLGRRRGLVALLGRYDVGDPVEPWTPDHDLGTEASGVTPSSS
jgi:hypothetical protein